MLTFVRLETHPIRWHDLHRTCDALLLSRGMTASLAQRPTRPRVADPRSLFVLHTEQARYATSGMDKAPVDLYCCQVLNYPTDGLSVFTGCAGKIKSRRAARTADLISLRVCGR